MAQPNYTLGRGKLYLKPDGASAFRYLGNSPAFNITVETETLEHFNSDEGIRVEDDSVLLQITRTASIELDDIQMENLAMAFLGTVQTVTQTAATGLTETIASAKPGDTYAIGVTSSNPAGVRDIDPATFTATINSGATTLQEGIDYNLDARSGLIHFLESTNITSAGVQVDITYGLLGVSRPQTISGSQAVEGELRYVAHNPKGKQIDYLMPKVQFQPDGDIELKGEEWMKLPFTVKIIKLPNRAAIYADGEPLP